MSDYASELPVRSQLPGQVAPDDIIIKLGDATNPTTQLAKVDTHGSQYDVLADSAGNLIGDQNLSSSYWLQTVMPSNGPASNGTAAAFSTLIGGIYNSATGLSTPLTAGQQASLQLDSAGRLLVDASVIFPYDENYGTVGANTLRTASQIGNATGAADFGAGATGAQTLRTTANQGTPNTAANAWPITITSGGAVNSPTNPVYVSSEAVVGTPINVYTDSVSVAKAASVNVDYTVSASKTFYTNQFWATGSGLMKLQVQYETAAASGVFNTFWVGFNSTATPAILIPVPNEKTQVAGARIRMIVTNLDNQAQDLYTTLSGTEQ